MSTSILNQVTDVINANPRSGQALLLFALVKTLDIEKGGHMYMLSKLKDMTPENRQLAFQLMALMAENKIHDDAWRQAVESMENTIRSM